MKSQDHFSFFPQHTAHAFVHIPFLLNSSLPSQFCKQLTATMDDFRTIVKTFQMLDNSIERAKSNSACLSVAKMLLDPIVGRNIQQFVNDHLTPAGYENAGTELGMRQWILKDNLERTLRKASWDDRADEGMNECATIPINARASQDMTDWSKLSPSSFAVAPAPRGVPTVSDSIDTNTTHHSWKTSKASGHAYPSPPTKDSPSQLEQVYSYGGADAVRILLELDDFDGTDKMIQAKTSYQEQSAQEMTDETVCADLSETYGGVWTAPMWAGKGRPERDLVCTGRQ